MKIEDRRHLQTSVNARCTRQLSTCQATGVSGALPIEEWQNKLDQLLEERKPSSAYELSEALTLSQQIDFSAVIDDVGILPFKERMVIGVKLWSGIIVQLSRIGTSRVGVKEASESLFQVAESIEQQPMMRQLSVFTIIIFVFEVLTLLVNGLVSDGVLGLFVAAIEALLYFFDTFARTMRTIYIMPFGDANECFAMLLQCEMDSMLGKVVPVLIHAM